MGREPHAPRTPRPKYMSVEYVGDRPRPRNPKAELLNSLLNPKAKTQPNNP